MAIMVVLQLSPVSQLQVEVAAATGITVPKPTTAALVEAAAQALRRDLDTVFLPVTEFKIKDFQEVLALDSIAKATTVTTVAVVVARAAQD